MYKRQLHHHVFGQGQTPVDTAQGGDDAFVCRPAPNERCLPQEFGHEEMCIRDRDLQEDKEPVFDAADTLELALPVMAGLLRTCLLYTSRCV